MPEETVQTGQQLDNVSVIYATLKREILNLAIPPGTVITEAEICGRFSVSRTPVRSVFQRLSDRKFIKIVPYKETKVTLIDLHQVKQLIYMRIALETKAAKGFIDLWDPLLIEKMRYYLRKQIVLLENDFTPQSFYAEDSAFHRIWFEALDMAFLWRKIQHAQVHYTRFRMLDIVGVKDFKSIVEEHEELFSIVEKKKKDDIEPFFTKHLNGGIKRLGNRIYTDYSSYFEKPHESGSPK
jgi:DNA-binding GntR family transcriptional regulator